MSVMRLNNRQAAGLRAPQRPQLSLVTSTNRLRSSRPALAIIGTVMVGAIGVALLNLLLTIMTSSAVYELANLQQQKKELITTTQILSEQVDSLASQQNLSNAAEKLGMITNANPVFLRLADQKVFGKPQAALNTDGRVARNLVPNSALTATSANVSTKTKTIAAADVANQKPAVVQVTSNGGAIPASPTH
ncbi:hypothetical protein [Rhodoluna sp.]|uniref:hypothetical protein n=1 Tax=Rhodoluna sp. TaxID=1969481 RepID=UPI0025CC52ED|nr:hypothetical protein [Rhodoluna sp.]